MHNILKVVPQDSFLISILFSLVLSLPFNVLLLSADFLENQGQSYSKSLAHLSRLWCSQLRGSSFFPLVLGSSKFVWMCFLTTFCFFPTGRQLKFSGCTVDTHFASNLTVQPQTKKNKWPNSSPQFWIKASKLFLKCCTVTHIQSCLLLTEVHKFTGV